MGEQEDDYSALPLLDRFVHKVWKVRKEAYENAAQQFSRTADESDPVFRPFLQDSSLWKGAVGDSNVAAQQEAVAALCAFLKYAGPQACTRTRSQTIPPLVEKGLSSTRAATKASALEALMLYIELDTPGPVIEELLLALAHKQPKIIAATLAAFTATYHAFGAKTMDPKPVLKALPKMFGHADKNVRAEAQNLAVELYRWLKEAMKPVFWADLKPVQQQDLDALFEKVKQDPQPTPERLLRSQQEALASGGDNAGGGECGNGDEAAEVDTFDLVEAVDISSKIPADFYEHLASTKWKDRKDSLDGLFAIINVPRIKESDHTELVRALAKCMKDANVSVLTVAANCIEALAKGLRTSFARYRSIVLSPMMERLKEKKQLVTDALGAALDAVFNSTGLSECLEETLGFFGNKNPQVKQESVRFLIRCLRTTRDAPSKAEVKLIADAATKLLTEGSEVLRSAGAEILGTLMKIMGERAMNPHVEGLDDIRKAKIKEYFEKAEVKAKDKPKPAAPAPAPKAAGKAGGGGAGGPKKAGEKKAGAAAAAASKAAPAADESATQAPLQPKPTARSIPSKPGGPPRQSAPSTPGGGLRTLKRPGAAAGAAAATAAAATASTGSPTKAAAAQPAAAAASSPTAAAEEPAPPPPKPGFTGRGLAGRPLGRPVRAATPPEQAAAPAPEAQPPATSTTAAAAAAPPQPVLVQSGLAAVERAELEQLRGENEQLRRLNDELRAERSRLTVQVYELQNRNAELIEDHTRDVLSIKAKETQLVRARSDADAAEQLCLKQQREMERLKRELGRAVRAASPAPSLSPGPGPGPGAAELGEHHHIYRDNTSGGAAGAGAGTGGVGGGGGGGLNGAGGHSHYANHLNHHHHLTGYAALNYARPASRRAPYSSSSAAAAALGSGEEKENSGPPDVVVDVRGMKFVPPASSAASSVSMREGNGSAASSGHGGHHDGGGGHGGGSGGGGRHANGEGGIESWKRAAEVTSALKARIEQMKARQGLARQMN